MKHYNGTHKKLIELLLYCRMNKKYDRAFKIFLLFVVFIKNKHDVIRETKEL